MLTTQGKLSFQTEFARLTLKAIHIWIISRVQITEVPMIVLKHIAAFFAITGVIAAVHVIGWSCPFPNPLLRFLFNIPLAGLMIFSAIAYVRYKPE